MPQLDPSTFSSQLFWLFVTFFSLYLILQFLVLPKFAKVFDQRERSIDGKLDDAKRLRDEAERMMEEYEQTIETAKDEARHRYLSVLQEVSAEMAQRQKEMVESINTKVREAEAQIIIEKEKAKEQLLPEATGIAHDILKKLLGDDVKFEDLKKYQRN